jgi:raffinose/stachyose/melibiose transport system substrate-binding protein
MVKDGVLSSKSVLVDSGTGLSNYSNGKYVIYLTGQWDAGNITPEAQAVTKLIAFPSVPGEKGNAGSIAAAIQVGYGITVSGAKNPAVRDAALKFLAYFNSEAEVSQRLRDGGIVAPVLYGYKVPDDMPLVVKIKAELGMKTKVTTDVIDAFISGPQNDAINAGCQKIVSGTATPAQVAAEVEALRK